MARFPSIDETGAFEAPEVQNKIKELVTGGAGDIRVDTSVGTRVFVGDTMIYGDTGWRDMRNELINGWEHGSSATQVLLRRENSTVFFQMTLVSGANAESEYFFSLPNGFRVNTNTTRIPMIASSGGVTPILSRVHYDGRIRAERLSEVNVAGSFSTNNAWPTSLPGLPA